MVHQDVREVDQGGASETSHYTALMIERVEYEMGETQQQPVRPVPKTKVMPKAKSQPMPEMTEIETDEDDPWLAAEMAPQPNYAADPMTQDTVSALQGRMSQVENALGEILNHLRTNNS